MIDEGDYPVEATILGPHFKTTWPPEAEQLTNRCLPPRLSRPACFVLILSDNA
jgi:hypothetical protein